MGEMKEFENKKYQCQLWPSSQPQQLPKIPCSDVWIFKIIWIPVANAVKWSLVQGLPEPLQTNHDYVQGVSKKDIDSSQIPYSVVTSDPDHPSTDLLGQVMDNWGGPWSFAQLSPSQTGSYG